MKESVCFFLFCWCLSGSGLALPDCRGLPDAGAPAYENGVTPQGKIYVDEVGTRFPERRWKDPGTRGICMGEAGENVSWLREPFGKDIFSHVPYVQYQWEYRRGHLMKAPYAFRSPVSCWSGTFPVRSRVTHEELEAALEDTLMVVKPFLQGGASALVFHCRGKVDHSLNEVRNRTGMLTIRYVVFSPDVGKEDQAAVRTACWGLEKCYIMKDMFDAGSRTEGGILHDHSGKENPVVFMEECWCVPVSFFIPESSGELVENEQES